MKRQSTTAKITLATIELLKSATDAGEGVIIRYRGVEMGLEQVDGKMGFARYGDGPLLAVLLTHCTIRKTTVAQLEACHNDSGERCTIVAEFAHGRWVADLKASHLRAVDMIASGIADYIISNQTKRCFQVVTEH